MSLLEKVKVWGRGPKQDLDAEHASVFDEETVVVADCDLAEITRESLTLDVSGHYSRPDVFEFRVRPRRPADG